MNTLLKSIIQTCSVPGNEIDLRDLLIEEFQKYGKIHRSKWTGFYCAHKNNSKKKQTKIVITAHMDSPGFIVKDIEDSGELTIISLGGLNPSLMDLRQVKLRTKDKIYPGIITLKDKDVTDRRMATYKGFFGFLSEKDAEKKGVCIGDSVCFDSPIVEMENNLISAPHLDNRLGIFSLLNIAKKLSNENLDCNIYFAATDCEETGGRGAKILANMIQPNIAICLDTTYEEGRVKMSKGPVLTLADAAVLLPTTTRDSVGQIAKENKVPLQYEVYNYAGTDAKDFKDVGDGCLTLCLLIATLNNHSPHEICSLKDLESTKKLVCSIIKNHHKLVV
ncbi:M42 family metallopeptidase [Candidatus Uabimicrobium sp. HlEnr_7]|uniref:M42 family metallopeptidase n=1 Tax=Candidatus Uabimicrobium helgolandensis TaxID=3095367 RepID=UPI003556D6BB